MLNRDELMKATRVKDLIAALIAQVLDKLAIQAFAASDPERMA